VLAKVGAFQVLGGNKTIRSVSRKERWRVRLGEPPPADNSLMDGLWTWVSSTVSGEILAAI